MEQRVGKQKTQKLRRIHVAPADREFFLTNLAVLLKAAVPVGEALLSLEETTPSGRLKKVLHQLGADIDEGMSLTAALERSGLASHQTLTLIELGEQTGKLVENLALAAKQEQKQRLFQAKLRSAMLYPTFVLSMTVIVGLGVAWLLLPKLSETFTQLRVELPLISKVFIGLGMFLQDNGIWAVPLFLMIFMGLISILFVLPKTRGIGMGLLLHMPGIGKLIQEVEVARFGYLLSTLLETGLPITRALPLLERATQVPAYKRWYAYLAQQFQEGYSFRESFKANKKTAKVMPPAVQQIIIAGERSGSLPDALSVVADTYDEKVAVTTENFQAIIEPVLLVIVWLGVMAVAVAVILPIYSLVGGLNG